MNTKQALGEAIARIPKDLWVPGESNKVHWTGCVIDTQHLVSTDEEDLVTCIACRRSIDYKNGK